MMHEETRIGPGIACLEEILQSIFPIYDNKGDKQ